MASRVRSWGAARIGRFLLAWSYLLALVLIADALVRLVPAARGHDAVATVVIGASLPLFVIGLLWQVTLVWRAGAAGLLSGLVLLAAADLSPGEAFPWSGLALTIVVWLAGTGLLRLATPSPTPGARTTGARARRR